MLKIQKVDGSDTENNVPGCSNDFYPKGTQHSSPIFLQFLPSEQVHSSNLFPILLIEIRLTHLPEPDTWLLHLLSHLTCHHNR